MNSERTPLILIILKLPFLLTRFLVSFLGCFTYAPFYLYLRIFQGFIFSDKFNKDNGFYLTFFLFRFILAAIPFAFGAYVSYFTTVYLYNLTISEGTLAMIVVEFFSWAFLLFSYRYGYLTMFKKFGFMQLKSVAEYFTIIGYGLEDLLAIVLTLAVSVMFFHVKKLFLFHPQPDRRKYLKFVFHLFQLSLLDVIFAVFIAILYIPCPYKLGNPKFF